MMELGVPYGYIDPDTGEQICPVKGCGLRFKEEFDLTGEQLSDNYGRHYMAVHAAKEGDQK